jgi:predicted nuclease of restriction endonuclease-like (RecB) superfamily
VKQPVSQFDHTSRSYVELLGSLKSRIQQARTKALLSVNREITALYWVIGHQIVEAQNHEGWGTSMIDRLAHDLQSGLPSRGGLSARNLWRMRAFYLAYPASEVNLPQLVADLATKFLPQAVAEIPWGHNIALIEKVKDSEQRLWYAEKTIEHGWSRAVLVHQIESDLFGRQGKALTNFEQALPAPQSDLAREVNAEKLRQSAWKVQSHVEWTAAEARTQRRMNVSQTSCKIDLDCAPGPCPRGVLVCGGRKESSMWSQIATTQRESYMRSL